MRRDPIEVDQDLRTGLCTPEDAELIDGVVANGNGHGAEATRARRDDLRRRRLVEAMPVSDAIERWGSEGVLAGSGS